MAYKKFSHTLDMSATGVTPWIDARGCALVRTMIVFPAGPVGTLQGEVSLDGSLIEDQQRTGAADTAAFVDNSASWQAFSGAGAVAVQFPTSGFVVSGSAKTIMVVAQSGMFVRYRFTRTSGSGILTLHWALTIQ